MSNKKEFLTSALSKINTDDYKSYLLTEDPIVSNSIASKILNNIPDGISYLEKLALKELITYFNHKPTIKSPHLDFGLMLKREY